MIEKAQNKGVGSFCLQHIVSLSEKSHTPIFLRVFMTNPAQNLYKRFGFEVYDQTQSHYLMQYVPGKPTDEGNGLITGGQRQRSMSMPNDAMNAIKTIYSSGGRFDEMLTYANRKLKRWEADAAAMFPAKASVLDIGCGKGREAFCLHEMGFGVTGLDISETCVEAARATAKAHGLDMAFVVSNGRDLPFAEAAFDVVIIWAQTFGLFADEESRRHMLDECQRVLKRGGLLSFSTHDKEYLRAHYPAFLVGDVFHPFADGELAYMTYTIDELAALAEEAGFQVITCQRGSVYTAQDGTVLHCACQRT